jgi:hypothetical protein
MKIDLTTGTWQDNPGCPINITSVSTSDVPPSPKIDHNPPPPPRLHGQDRHQVSNIKSMALQSSGSEQRQFLRWERDMYLTHRHASSTLLHCPSLSNPPPPPHPKQFRSIALPVVVVVVIVPGSAALIALFLVVDPHGQDRHQVRLT